MVSKTNRWVLPALGVGVGWSLIAFILDISGHRPTPSEPVDAVVVAGCSVEAGGTPSDCLMARTDHAIGLYRAGTAPVLIFTGGTGVHPPSEAEVAAQRATAAGVPAEHIRMETRSTSTWENAAFSSKLGTFPRILVVTDAWHTHRVRRVFSHHYEDVLATGVDSPLATRTYGAHREVLALLYYGLLGRL